MKVISILLAGGLLVPAFGQTGVIAQGDVSGKGFTLYWQSRLEPPTPPMGNGLGYGSGTNERNGDIFRIMIDRSKRTYFGYEVHVESIAPRNTYKVAFHQLDISPEVLQRRLHMDDPSSWKKIETGTPVAKPLYPFREAQDIVHTLDVIAVELLMNPETGQKIVDYVVLQEPTRTWNFELPSKREFAYAPGTPKDFTVKDAALTLADPRLRINDRIEESTVNSRIDVSGPMIWVYLQNHGRYLLSLVPQPGFRKVGEVRGTSLSFAWGDDRFTIASAGRIAPGDAPFNLYVKEETGWKPPAPNYSGIMFGASDSGELH
jgi:hypothetical protein